MIAAGLSQAVLVVLMWSTPRQCDAGSWCTGQPVASESIPMPSMAACQAELPSIRLEKHVLHAFCVDQQERAR